MFARSAKCGAHLFQPFLGQGLQFLASLGQCGLGRLGALLERVDLRQCLRQRLRGFALGVGDGCGSVSS